MTSRLRYATPIAASISSRRSTRACVCGATSCTDTTSCLDGIRRAPLSGSRLVNQLPIRVKVAVEHAGPGEPSRGKAVTRVPRGLRVPGRDRPDGGSETCRIARLRHHAGLRRHDEAVPLLSMPATGSPLAIASSVAMPNVS